MDSDRARGVVEILNRNGFSSDEIGVLKGREDAERLDAATGKKASSPSWSLPEWTWVTGIRITSTDNMPLATPR
jgi:hypothetical protein